MDLTGFLCLQLLTNHYEQNWKYYCLPSGMGSFGTASDEELLLTKKLFWGIFDSLSHKVLQGCGSGGVCRGGGVNGDPVSRATAPTDESCISL